MTQTINHVPKGRDAMVAHRTRTRRLHERQRQGDALKRLQTDTAAELAASLPALLDPTFKGEF
jgi:hypothetical protein